MDQWLRRAFRGHEMYCHDLEVVGLNTSQAELANYDSRNWTWMVKQHTEGYH